MEQLIYTNPPPPPSPPPLPERSHSPLYERLYANGIAALKQRKHLHLFIRHPELTFQPKIGVQGGNKNVNGEVYERLYKQGTVSLQARLDKYQKRPLPKGTTFQPTLKSHQVKISNCKKSQTASTSQGKKRPNFGNRLSTPKKLIALSAPKKCTFCPQINQYKGNNNNSTTIGEKSIFDRLYDRGRKCKSSDLDVKQMKLDVTTTKLRMYNKAHIDRLHAQGAERWHRRQQQQQLEVARIKKRSNPSLTKKNVGTAKSVVSAVTQSEQVPESTTTTTGTPLLNSLQSSPTTKRQEIKHAKKKVRSPLHDPIAQKLKRKKYDDLLQKKPPNCTFQPKVNSNAKRSPGFSTSQNAGDRLHQQAVERIEKIKKREQQLKKKIRLPKKKKTFDNRNELQPDDMYNRAILRRQERENEAKEALLKERESLRLQRCSQKHSEEYTEGLYQRGMDRLKRKDEKTIKRYQGYQKLTIPSQIEPPPSLRKTGRELPGSPRSYLPGGKVFSPPTSIDHLPGFENYLPKEVRNIDIVKENGKNEAVQEHFNLENKPEREASENVERMEREKRIIAYERRKQRTVQTQILDRKLAKREQWLNKVADPKSILGWETGD